MGAWIRILVVAALVAAVFLYKYNQKSAPALTGSVTHFATGAPFGGSTVVLTCEGRKMLTTSAKDGEFSFSAKEIKPCIVYGTLEAQASGYQDSQLIGKGLVTFMPTAISKEKEPHRLKLVGDSEVSQAKLDALWQRAFGPPQPDWTKTAIGAYARLVNSLSESVRIAASAAEKQWVREQYCERLKAAWAGLDRDQKENALLVKYYPDDFAEVCQ
jgi:hypothetical protein